MGESSRGPSASASVNDSLYLDNSQVMASNVPDRLRGLQLTLQSPVVASGTPGESRTVSGYLYMQKNMGEWKKLWCEFGNGELIYRRDVGSKTTCGRIPVSFCEAELIHERYLQESKQVRPVLPFSTPRSSSFVGPVVPLSPTQRGPRNAAFTTPLLATATSTLTTLSSLTRSPVAEERRSSSSAEPGGKYDELYYVCLGSQGARHAFKVFSPARTYVFRADTDLMRDEFCNAIFEWLKLHLDENAFRRKVEALKELNPVIREQFLIHDSHYNQLVQTLAKSGFLEDELPITSTRKEKCGVLSMEVGNEGLEWKDYYFVLFEGTLFYYKDSKSTAPTGFLTLKYASVDLDPIGLTRGDYRFEVKTPLRTVVCRAKHTVALAEWIASLDSALSTHVKKTKGAVKRSSMEVLNDINRMIGDIATFRTLAAFPACLAAFKDHLGDQAAFQLDFVFAVDHLKATKLTNFEQQAHTTAIFNQFFGTEQSNALTLPPTVLGALRQVPVSFEMFDEAVHWCEKHLEAAFAGFKETTTYRTMSFFGENPTALGAPINRRGVNFEANMVQSFLVKVKGSKKSVEVRLSPKRDVLTIGRDKSNLLVVEDSRVSRSHARVEYTDTQCEYIDLGSSCGSKLNGKPVLRVKLQPGDVLEIGQSTLIFQVTKKGRFAFFGIA